MKRAHALHREQVVCVQQKIIVSSVLLCVRSKTRYKKVTAKIRERKASVCKCSTVCVSKQRTSDGKIVRKLKKLISARLNVVADSAARALGIKITKSVRKK